MEKLKKGKVYIEVKNNWQQILLFAFVFTFMFVYLLNIGTMTNISGDAVDLWKFITTFGDGSNGPQYASYVLYKGYGCMYPALWLYNLSKSFGVNEFLFLMIYQSLLYSYIAVVATPKLVELLFNYKPKYLQRILLPVVLFVIWKQAHVITQFTMDLPACAFFMLMTNSALKLKEKQGYKKIISFAYIGFMFGLCTNTNGMYTIAAPLVLIYVLVVTIPIKVIKEKAKIIFATFGIFAVVAGIGISKLVEINFDHTVLEPFAKAGTPIAAGSKWLERNMIYMMDKTRLFYGSTLMDVRSTIIDNRGAGIVEDFYGKEAVPQEIDLKTYVKMVLKYPIDFISRYVDRAFVAFSPDNCENKVSYLLLGYTLLFLAIISTIKEVKTVRQFFTSKLWIVIAFIFTLAASMATTTEMRYSIAVQALVYGAALTGPILPEIFRAAKDGIIQCKNTKSLVPLIAKKFPWKVILYIVFVICCFSHMGLLYAQRGTDASILFQW